jgi:hypothetical protein
MKVQELRIGNYILGMFQNNDGMFQSVIELNLTVFNEIAEWEGNDYEPIELTEEWLVKFGFEFNNLNETHYFENFSFRLHLRENEFFYNWIGGNIFIQHVHRLQNLYFALTGEELTIEHAKTSKPIN